MQKSVKGTVINSKVRDSGGKIIFGDNILCAQFLRDYIHLPYLKDVQPEDIEDVSDQFVPLFSEERNADRVKRINIRGENPFFLISLIEHKTTVDYNVCMQIFRYMIYIWDAYEKEAEKRHEGISKRADFRYPIILPIVYYEGADNWTVPLDFKSRINQGEAFGKYVPAFEYYLVPLREYSNEQLLEKADEISLVMLINKLQSPKDVEKFRQIPPKQLENILKETPKHLLDIIANVLLVFLLKENVPAQEAENLVEKVREKKMARLFENMEKMDIQAERRNTLEQRERAERAEQKAEEAEQKAEEVRQMLESSIRLFVESCQEFNVTKKALVEKFVEKFQVEPDVAKQKVEAYWK